MKKILLVTLFSSVLLFASNSIELTGKYSQDLGNPFRVLLEKKNETVSIYSETKDIELNVESNFDNNTIYNIHLQHPKKYILKNKTVENVVESYYSEEYEVLHQKGDIEVNVQSGKIFITYIEEENNQINHISKVEVELNLEIIKKGKKTLKTINMDDKLGRSGDNYNYSISLNDLKNISINNITTIVEKIIETELYILIKG